jgi:hypothetical protein
MSEPFLERLSRFTPDAGSLERDALLFAAGRSSARPNRGWITLAAVLAGTQTLLLALLWPQPNRPASGLSVPVANLPAPPAAPERPTTADVARPGLWTVRQGLLVGRIGDASYDLGSETEERLTGDTFIDSDPPLRAFAPMSPSILN